jgi:hypothetical protein
MAAQLTLTGSEYRVKLRRPWTVAVLSVVTLGVYTIVWYYQINREMRDFGSSRGDFELARSRPWRSVIAITIGGVVVVPTLASYLGVVDRLRAVERMATGAGRSAFGLKTALVSSLLIPFGAVIYHGGLWFAIVGWGIGVATIALLQARLNAAWRASETAEHGHLDATSAVAT